MVMTMMVMLMMKKKMMIYDHTPIKEEFKGNNQSNIVLMKYLNSNSI